MNNLLVLCSFGCGIWRVKIIQLTAKLVIKMLSLSNESRNPKIFKGDVEDDKELY